MHFSHKLHAHITHITQGNYNMKNSVNESSIQIQATYSRYINIDEDIYEALSLQALSLYMTLRFEADYRCDHSTIKRTAKFLYTKAKLSRSMYFTTLNELENLGLVLRDPGNQPGEVCSFHIAKELGYFKRVVSPENGVVQNMDTNNQYSFQNNNSISESSKKSKTQKKDLASQLEELIAVYREEMPDNPQPFGRVVSTTLRQTLLSLIKQWPQLDPEGKALTPEAFRRYLKMLKIEAPQFALGTYQTADGRTKKNGLITFARWNTVVRFLEGAYS